MADLSAVMPYLLGLLATAVAWLFKATIQTGKDVVELRTAFKYYIESTAKGAARVLDSPNPTPPEIRTLLRKFERRELTDDERRELKTWLRGLQESPNADRSERSAAIQILASMEAMKVLRAGRGRN